MTDDMSRDADEGEYKNEPCNARDGKIGVFCSCSPSVTSWNVVGCFSDEVESSNQSAPV